MRRSSSRARGETRRGERPGIPTGGRYRPLSDSQQKQITDAAFDILATIGLGGAPSDITDIMLAGGATRRDDGRLLLSRSLVEDLIAVSCRRVDLPGFKPEDGITVGGGRVHIGTAGAAVQVLDGETGEYRDSTLRDLYGLMRVVDHCDQVRFSLRPAVARDMNDSMLLDVNTAFAAMKATSKPIGTSFFLPENVRPVVEMFDIALGGEGAFRKQPFCFASICHVVPPLTFGEDACAVLLETMKHGMPLQLCSAAQAGATSPAALAGALAQGLAESLAGLALVNMISPGHPCVLAFLPFISDLRTGAMSGGGGESAIANAAAAQLLLGLDVPSAASAGMTDAKSPDPQYGYEKGYTIALAANAGADMINLSVGMLGSIMAASKEALIVDNDMCAAIMRTVRGVEISENSIDLEMIEKVVTGEGHYLGTEQTLALMKTEYVYPTIGDRRSIFDWVKGGSPTVWGTARERVREIESLPPPEHLSASAETVIREKLPIRLEV